MITLRRSTDYALLDDLDHEMFPIDTPETKVASNILWWVLWDDDRAIGFTGLKLLDSGVAFLLRSGVVKDYQGRGLQKKMIQVREKAARKLEYETIITYTERHNYASANNLISQGYKLYYPEYVYGFRTALYFIKNF